MIKRAVIRVQARGYVDGRFIGEEKEPVDTRDDNRGNGRSRRRKGAKGNSAAPRGRGGKARSGPQAPRGPAVPGQARGPQPKQGQRKNRSGKKTPFRAPQQKALISEVAENRRLGDEVKSGQFAEALASQAHVKRERLHKVLAQSGHGSRRDMEIMISSGRVMVNGIVATTGTQVSPGDVVLIDHRPVKLKFTEELPRILLYHKPEGEIVTTSDPGNRITVFDNLPKVENGKWVAIGRLDINTSGLLIFTTNGELANRLMHPRYEVEREYAVRVLGELTEEQTARLLAGVNIDADEDDEDGETSAPARFDSIEKRGPEAGTQGSGSANNWYHVTIKEGRNREVRKMFEAVGLTVSRLIRVRFGKIELPPRLVRGKMMELDPSQVKSVLNWVGMKIEGVSGPSAPLPSRKQGKDRPAPPREVTEGGKGPRSRRGRGRRIPRGEVKPGAIEASSPGAAVAGNEPNGNVALPTAGDSPADGRPPRTGRNRPRRNFRARNRRNGPPKENAGNE
jgi:23S rRNA pseudouridine2605 synthase